MLNRKSRRQVSEFECDAATGIFLALIVIGLIALHQNAGKIVDMVSSIVSLY